MSNTKSIFKEFKLVNPHTGVDRYPSNSIVKILVPWQSDVGKR
jgi:hypothetical protein